MKYIRILVMDVDGTLTDGKIYISDGGELFKSFNTKDGYGIKEILPQYGIIPVIITGRKSLIIEIRAKELNVTEVHQGVADKAAALERIIEKFGINRDEIACIGDDDNDITMMKLAGISACPADASEAVKAHADIVLTRKGGESAVREFIDILVGMPDHTTGEISDESR